MGAGVAYDIIRIDPWNVVRECARRPVDVDDADAGRPAAERIVVAIKIGAGSCGAVLVRNEEDILREHLGGIVIDAMRGSDDN